MTTNFDNIFHAILEQIDTSTMKNILLHHQKKIRSYKVKNYEAEPQLIDKIKKLKESAIREYREFVERNRDELYKNNLGDIIDNFEKELKNIQRF